MEILVLLHTKSLLEFTNKDESSEVLGSNSTVKLTLPALSPAQLTGMLSANIRANANHPCLLVEHYMPRQLLLMEPGERLIRASDKFRKMAMLLHSISNRDRARFPDKLQILILSHSIKELDLIEGFLLGRPIKLKRLSGTSLYDEKHNYGETEAKKKSPVPSAGNMKDDYEYGERRASTKPKDNSDWLFLATATHLARDPSLMDEYKVDIVIGFDPLIDEDLESFQRMRKGGKHVPLIKLLVENSPDHYALSCNKNRPDGDHFVDSLLHFIKTRHTIAAQNHIKWMGQFVEKILSNSPNSFQTLPPCELASYDNSKTLSEYLTNGGYLSPLPHTDCNLLPVNHDLDMKLYQAKMMEMIVQRLNASEKEYSVRQEEVLSKRLRETMRQNELDEMKEESGRMYKKLKDGEGDLNESTKRLQKAQNDYRKLQEQSASIKSKTKMIQTMSEGANVTEELKANEQRLLALKSELEALLEENSKQASINDELRLQYQTKSSEAANESLNLKNLQNNTAQLKIKLEGPALSLRFNSAHEQESHLRETLVRTAQQSQFLQGYIKNMHKQYHINGSQATKRSPPNSGNSRTRNSRSSAIEVDTNYWA